MQSSETELKRRWKHLLRFLIQLWTVAAVFSLIGIFSGNPVIPGSIKEFLLNCLTIKNSYNGAWWYANTYIFLVALQPLSCRFVKRCPAWAVLPVAFIFYTVGYGIRFWGWGNCNSALLSWIITHIGLLGTSYLPYIIGMLFCKKRIITFLRQKIIAFGVKSSYIHIFVIVAFVGMIVAHGIVPSLFVAVITATATITLLCVCRPPVWLTNLLCYFGEHSTNVWLIHMFFYTVLFDGFVFYAKYPIAIFLLLVALSLASSYVIKWISKPILKLVR